MATFTAIKNRGGGKGALGGVLRYTLFFDPEAGGFTTVDENTRFYIRADGVPVLVFQEYTIAAGSAGIVEIPVEDTQT